MRFNGVAVLSDEFRGYVTGARSWSTAASPCTTGYRHQHLIRQSEVSLIAGEPYRTATPAGRFQEPRFADRRMIRARGRLPDSHPASRGRVSLEGTASQVGGEKYRMQPGVPCSFRRCAAIASMPLGQSARHGDRFTALPEKPENVRMTFEPCRIAFLMTVCVHAAPASRARLGAQRHFAAAIHVATAVLAGARPTRAASQRVSSTGRRARAAARRNGAAPRVRRRGQSGRGRQDRGWNMPSSP